VSAKRTPTPTSYVPLAVPGNFARQLRTYRSTDDSELDRF
jgi:hypothetical protein